ncbi:DUF3427 domain-containing protein [Arthrobacter psychrolactophilus]|uniref:DUF3427 domain-containing protein n=1 Tax=Arthrobacter psychrolactophilus TaxID=92442 RepID=A0A2V5IRR2_9MICC|nr:DEAD/DEAH box helicase [Arthrobacter psychrolactophilus]PYI39238.1 DUF3427 domain-containing protein [Arthrobacter psychrolactophilus]
MSFGAADVVRADTAFGFIDSATTSDQVFHPVLISNENENTMLRAIRQELQRSKSFIISVAFITTSAIALLKEVLLQYDGPGVIVTSTYLGFNSPEMFRELLSLEDVDVYVHPGTSGGFHAKGYVFDLGDTTTAIIGSSNLTANALLRNSEWNLRFSALPDGDITHQLQEAIGRQKHVSEPLTANWITAYEEIYVQKPASPFEELLPSRVLDGPAVGGKIYPNSMQLEALEAISQVRDSGERRALVISATGTGKTILSALDVRAVDPARMLFIVHREQILDKAMSEFEQVLEVDRSSLGKFVGSQREIERQFVFATIQTISKKATLQSINRDHFDYILIDEVHRAGAESYRRLIDWFTPKFLLGLTATPERTDDFNVFELFDFNVPYEIRLQAALEAQMLVPFHYYGVTDYVDSDGTTVDDTSNLTRLVAPERVEHLIRAIKTYGHAGPTRGLMFCSRRDEAYELSRLLNHQVVNGVLLRTKVLTGSDSNEVRNETVARLEIGDLDYILTVDIFNEGIDIPSINQVVMLRQTQSNIIFTQQLGRGLRKNSGKDHLRVIDFIGNYANNYMIPIALLGDRSLNKDAVRRKLINIDQAGTISGLSSVNFDRVSRERILQSLANTSLDSLANIKMAFNELAQRLGRTPLLFDFARYDSVDPVVVATKSKNYWSLQNRFKVDSTNPTNAEESFLNFLTMELMNGKRPHELLLLEKLLAVPEISVAAYKELLRSNGSVSDDKTLDSVRRILSLEFFTSGEQKKYGSSSYVDSSNGAFKLSEFARTLLNDSTTLRGHVQDVIATGKYLARHRYDHTGTLQVGKMYSRKDVCRLLNWKSNEYSTMYGYKVDQFSQSCPIFVTYHKADHVAESTRYEDEFVDPTRLKWFTRSNRTLKSAEVRSIVNGDVPLHIFVKKDDAEGSDFYYLGQADSRDADQTTMAGKEGKELSVVTMGLDFITPIENGLYEYISDQGVQERS